MTCSEHKSNLTDVSVFGLPSLDLTLHNKGDQELKGKHQNKARWRQRPFSEFLTVGQSGTQGRTKSTRHSARAFSLQSNLAIHLSALSNEDYLHGAERRGNQSLLPFCGPDIGLQGEAGWVGNKVIIS